jgi:formylglycine-generating enzyme required for sulfatase activity
VVGVSWWEAEAFCKWAGARLPTADQAEAAARGPKGFKYPWGDDWEDGICNSSKAGLVRPSAVGIFPRDRSPFAVMDVSGNVYEWCVDRHGGGLFRVLRGGGWDDGARDMRSAYRLHFVPGFRDRGVGFRCAQVPPGQSSQEAEPGA